ncbi:MAG: short-chain dehydrogenase [Chloroflexi bacterium]|nr:MAG: short-chain dehydrogenase [Chloroflexota bacterium]
MGLQGKVAIITGAARGIGRASAIEFAREGARVVIADVNEEGLAETEREAGSFSDVTYRVTDVSRAADVKALVDDTIDRFGKLDVLFNNAGVLTPASVVELDEDIWDRTININLKSVYLGCKYAIPHMLSNGGGSIINTGSVNSLVAEPFLPAYCASKGGILMLTKQVALDYAQQNIRVNCICPGWVDTPINNPHADMMGGVDKVLEGIADWQPMGRQGQPREIARVAVFLASDDSSFMTGSAVVADGGMTAK